MIEQNKLLLSKTDDLIACVIRGRPLAFTSFLKPEEQKAVCDRITSSSLKFDVYSGYDGAERNMICIYDDVKPEETAFPMSSLSFTLSDWETITHRDVLGALMSLGLKREFIGDIIFFDGKCVFFTDRKITEYVIGNFFSVKHHSISVNEYNEEIDFSPAYEIKDIIVSSMRVDCIVSELCSVSRTVAAQLTVGGFIFINGAECNKKDRSVSEGDIISIRKKGKYRVDSNCGATKKGRIKLKVLKYI